MPRRIHTSMVHLPRRSKGKQRLMETQTFLPQGPSLQENPLEFQRNSKGPRNNTASVAKP